MVGGSWTPQAHQTFWLLEQKFSTLELRGAFLTCFLLGLCMHSFYDLFFCAALTGMWARVMEADALTEQEHKDWKSVAVQHGNEKMSQSTTSSPSLPWAWGVHEVHSV